MRTTVIILIFLSYFGFSQTKSDTMFIGNKKVLLKKTKPYLSYRGEPILLNSEYADITDLNTKIIINYRHLCDSSEETSADQEGNVITTKVWRRTCDTSTNNKITLYAFADTVFVTAQSLCKLKPFIKVNSKKIYFSAARVRTIKDGSVYVYEQRMSLDGQILSMLDNDSYSPLNQEEIDNRKKTVYVLDNLCYIRNNVPYYLERQFILLVK